MSRPSHISRYISALLLLTPLTLAFMSHGCSGGGSSDPATPTPIPTATPVPETIQAIGTVSESEVAFVGKLDTTVGGTPSIGSCVLIAPQYIVTAAHNVTTGGRIYRPGKVTFGNNIYTISTDVQIKYNPNYNETDFGSGDIAIVKLDTPVTGITPAIRLNGISELGKQVVHRGFGLRNGNNNGKLGYNIVDGTADQLNTQGFKAIQTQVEIKNATPLCLIMDYDDGSATGNSLSAIGSSATPMPSELVVTAGDSGGGLFVRTNNGLRLVGIAVDLAGYDNDRNLTTESVYGRVSSYTRISAYKDWIESNLN
jgi:secreted trypsin-like serine protease